MESPIISDASNGLAGPTWRPGVAPIAVVMIALNEGHNMHAVLQNLQGWAQEVFLVDSYSQDDTIDIALKYGVHVVQRQFRGFGDQWNFALSTLPISAPWTMKLDPDERIPADTQREIMNRIQSDQHSCYMLSVRLFFIQRALPLKLNLLRLWKSGTATMSEVTVNEHIIADGTLGSILSPIEHHDSPDLEHWMEKQNRYTTAEALAALTRSKLSASPRLFGNVLQRRMWLKSYFSQVPGRFQLLFIYYYVVKGAWRAGWVGFAWASLRVMVMRMIEYKLREMRSAGYLRGAGQYGSGQPDSRVVQFD